MKISIITVCFNAAETIKDTIESVASQNYSDIEYIVVDGSSTDSTVELISSAAIVDKFISEPDNGIYDAMNKGIRMASGDVIGILNADDFYAAPDVLSQVAAQFNEQSIDACYSDLVYVEQCNTEKIIRYWQSCPFENGLFLKGWMPPHPTFFCRKSVYEKHGVFNLDYKIAADVELLFRLLEKEGIRTAYLPEVLIKMRLGGTTNQSLENIKRQNAEVLKCLNGYYGRVSKLKFYSYKLLNRLSQYFRKPKAVK